MDRGDRKTRVGVVVSDKMDKTVTVRVQRQVAHPKYERIIRRYTTFVAHDDKDACATGDMVKIIETRPLSKTKRWRVVEILHKAR
jgi:small subunit ribosomal protein S17